MPPTNFLGDYGRQRQRAVVVDAGVRGPPDGNTRAATVECADLARAFVFNDISNDFDQQCQDFDVAVDPVRRSLGDEEFPHVLLPLPHRADGFVVEVDGLAVADRTSAEESVPHMDSALIFTDCILIYSISTCI